jgi:hypothetical protein
MARDWLDTMERRVGFLAMPGLASWLAGMNAAVGVLALFKPEFPERLSLEPAALAAGEAWRALTFLFIPPMSGPLWLAVWIVLIYSVMRALEQAWGEFRFTVFMLAGAAAMSAAAMSWGIGFSNGPLQLSVFLAYARLNPELQLMLFFVLPVRVRTLGLLAWLWAAWTILFGGAYARLATLAGLANYLLFFGPEHWAELQRMLSRRR